MTTPVTLEEGVWYTNSASCPANTLKSLCQYGIPFFLGMNLALMGKKKRQSLVFWGGGSTSIGSLSEKETSSSESQRFNSPATKNRVTQGQASGGSGKPKKQATRKTISKETRSSSESSATPKKTEKVSTKKVTKQRANVVNSAPGRNAVTEFPGKSQAKRSNIVLV